MCRGNTPERQGMTSIRSRVTLLPRNDVDTDQIIPVRFLDRHDDQTLRLGLFANWRAEDPRFPLHYVQPQESAILFVGSNFGCGSSREHAVWALRAYGYSAVIARSFADIFFENALKGGLVPVALDSVAHESLHQLLLASPQRDVIVDLRTLSVSTVTDEFAAPFRLPEFSRRLFLEGHDDFSYLIAAGPKRLAYLQSGRAHRTQPIRR